MAAVYDKFAPHYDRFFAPLEWLGLSKLRQQALSQIPPDSQILEIGCGSGANFRFYPESRLAISSELSIKMLETAQTKIAGNHLVQADAQKLPFDENRFDAVFATLVFCSIPDPNAAFAEVRRVLRPGGLLILLEHVRPPGRLGRVFDTLSKMTERLFEDHFNRETLALAVAAGFRPGKVKTKLCGVVNLMDLYSEKKPSPAAGGLNEQ